MSDLKAALDSLVLTAPAYAEADAYFAGRQDEVFTSRRMAHALRHAGMRFRLNYARIPVTAVLDRMEIASVSSPDSRANAALQVIFDENQLDLFANDVHRDALKFGDTFVQVWPDESGFPEIHVTSPVSTKIIYDPVFPKKKRCAINTHVLEDGTARVDLYYPDRIERYESLTKDHTFPDDENQWRPFLDEQNSTTGILDNPFGEIPFFHFRTERPYGRPEHMDAYGAQDAINKHVTQQITANDFQSFPQRYLLSEMGGTAIPRTVGADYDDDWDDVPVDGSSNPTAAATTGPGTLLEFIGNNLQIGEFAAADPKVFLEPLNFYIQSIADTTGTPIHMFRAMGDAPSGESLRVREAPLIKKVRDRSVSFAASWREVFAFCLKTVGLEAVVELTWRDPQSVESKDAWETAKLKLEAGVPFEVVMQDFGFTLEEIQAWQLAAAPAQEAPVPTPEPEAEQPTEDEVVS